MKKSLVILFLLIISMGSYAQLSTIKIGANYNADIVTHKLGKISYPSYEFSFERALGKKFSINANYNYARRHYEHKYELSLNPGTYSGPTAFTHYDHTVIIEGRYYLTSNTKGLFFQLGIPFTFSTENRFYTSPNGDGLTKRTTFNIGTFGGMGIKYDLSPSFAVEMSMSLSPSLNFLGVDYGTSGFIKSGIKLIYGFGNKK